MRIDKLTSRLQLALADSQSLALGKDHNFIEPLHLMYVMLDQKGSSLNPLLKQLGVDVSALKKQVAQKVDDLPIVKGNDGDVHMSNELGRLFNIADKLAQKRQDQYISSELILLAALEDRGALGELLRQTGVQKEMLERAIDAIRGGER